MISNYKYFLTIICLTLLSCNNLYADGICTPDYPDQFPFLDVCNGVTPMVFDNENSVKEIGSNSSGIVYITGGSGRYTWSISGTGFSFDPSSTLNTLETNEQHVTIYNNEACGAAEITITDACTTTTGLVKSTNGQWLKVGEFTGPCRHYRDGEHPYYPPPPGVWIYSQTVNYVTYEHGLGTQYSGKYCLQIDGHSPSAPVVFPASTSNDYPYVWYSCLDTYEAHKNDVIIDPVVGVFSVPVVGGFNDRGTSSSCPGTRVVTWQLFANHLVVWEWVCGD